MMEIIYYVAMSLDGYIATPDGNVDWLVPFQARDEDYGYASFYDSVDGLLFGRQTYEQIVEFGTWPYLGKPSWVLSHRSIVIQHPEVTLTANNPEQVMDELRRRGLKRVWLVGGASLASSFRKAGAIHAYIITILPLMLGDGIRLIQPSSLSGQLELVRTQAYPQGAVQLHYRSANPPQAMAKQ